MHGMYTSTTQCQRKMCKKSKPVFRKKNENFSMQAKYAGNFHWAMSKVLRRALPWQWNKNSLRLDIIFVSAKTTYNRDPYVRTKLRNSLQKLLAFRNCNDTDINISKQKRH